MCRKNIGSDGGIPNLDMIVVLSDSELAINQIEGKYKTKDSHLAGLCGQVRGFRNFFGKAKIPVYFFHKPRHMMGAVHDITIKAMGGEEKYDASGESFSSRDNKVAREARRRMAICEDNV